MDPRGPRKCLPCGQHGVKVLKKRHSCPYANCECEKCAIIRNRRAIMNRQIKVRRTQDKALQMPITKREISPKVRLVYLCQRCKNHGIIQIRKNHRVCRFTNCACDQCKLMAQSTKIKGLYNSKRKRCGERQGESDQQNDEVPKSLMSSIQCPNDSELRKTVEAVDLEDAATSDASPSASAFCRVKSATNPTLESPIMRSTHFRVAPDDVSNGTVVVPQAQLPFLPMNSGVPTLLGPNAQLAFPLRPVEYNLAPSFPALSVSNDLGNQIASLQSVLSTTLYALNAQLSAHGRSSLLNGVAECSNPPR